MSARPTIPPSLLVEVERQRAAEILDHERRIEKLRAIPLEEWTFDFSDATQRFPQAVGAAVRLDGESVSFQYRCRHDNLERVVFRPYPSKYEGAWRIEVVFTRNNTCSGKEWYVTEEALFRAWNDAALMGFR